MFFVVLKYFGETKFYQRSMLSVAISHIAPLTFGIYIVHVLVMHAIGDGVFGMSLNIHTFDPWFSIPLAVGVTFFLSAFSVWLLKKIPRSHWILP